MGDSLLGRMLLSHNFNISEDIVPALSREEFAAIFIEGLSDCAQCRLVNNPHWIVEVLFNSSKFSSLEVGSCCAQVLAAKRHTQVGIDKKFPHILILGGIKTTPPMNNSPDSLQPGNWGVDIVETTEAEQFLLSIGWEAAIASKAPETIFKVELKG
jgi:Protein of unknown function (DUF2656)